MASGALRRAFRWSRSTAISIGTGDSLNTPLHIWWTMSRRRGLLIFQIDVFRAHGDLPDTLEITSARRTFAIPRAPA